MNTAVKIDIELISFEEAVKRLPEGDDIHTFLNPNGMVMIGADWRREAILTALRNAESIHVTGPSAQKTNHGIAIPYPSSHSGDFLFIETIPQQHEGGAEAGTVKRLPRQLKTATATADFSGQSRSTHHGRKPKLQPRSRRQAGRI